MTDHRIAAARRQTAEAYERGSLLDMLVKSAPDVEERFRALAAKLPYRASTTPVLPDGTAEMTRGVATATWRRLNEDVPDYAFAERLGRRYREADHAMVSVLLHWQLLRRAIHLVLAERKYRSGEGDERVLRQMMLMNYTIDWGTEASLVGYVLAGDRAGAARRDIATPATGDG